MAIQKLRDYCLSPTHPHGRHKARVFASVLGLGSEDASFLRRELLAAARSVEAFAGAANEFGTRYRIDFEIYRGGRRARIRSAWIIPKHQLLPKLTSRYVLLD